MWYTHLYHFIILPILLDCSKANTHSFTSSSRRICTIASSIRRTISSSKSKLVRRSTYGKCELDSHADSIVAGRNCIILTYTGKECDVSPYREDYESIKNVPIVTAATAWQSPITGQVYILVLNEALWMGDQMDHTLLNPNQLRHYGTRVQDDPTSAYPLSIITEDNEFCMELSMSGTIVYTETFSPSDKELQKYPHITLSSPHQWDPKRVKFPKCEYTLGEMMGDYSRQLSSVTINEAPLEDADETIFDLDKIQRQISSLQQVPSSQETLLRDDKIDSGSSDIPMLNTFQSTNRHTDVNPQQLSERWGISVNTAAHTLKHTT